MPSRLTTLLWALLLALLRGQSDQWIPASNLSAWYSDFDLCLVHSSSNGSIDEISRQCEKQSAPKAPTRCRAGNTWPSQAAYCSAQDLPFSERLSMQRAQQGYDQPSAQPLRSFFGRLAQEGGALLIVGDSVMQQFYSALACELEREGVWTDTSRFSNTDEVQYVRPYPNSSPVQIRFLPIYHFVNGRYERTPHAAMHSLKATLMQMTLDHSSLTVVANMGLHFIDNPAPGFSRHDYQSQMRHALTYMHTFAKNASKTVRVFWRETSAQHFPTSNGYWPGVKYSHTLRLACTPLADPSPQADWRNRDIERIVSEKGLFMIKIIPFYNLTAPLWDAHPSGHLKDCTHFCWTPMLYQSVFHRMDQGMGEVWNKNPQNP